MKDRKSLKLCSQRTRFQDSLPALDITHSKWYCLRQYVSMESGLHERHSWVPSLCLSKAEAMPCSPLHLHACHALDLFCKATICGLKVCRSQQMLCCSASVIGTVLKMETLGEDDFHSPVYFSSFHSQYYQVKTL